jgi:hypothetical protein
MEARQGAKAKAQRYVQTRPGRVVLLQLRAGHAERSRTHYLAGSGVHCGYRQGILLVKNEKRPPATEPSSPVAKLDPPDHTQPKPAPPWTQRVPGGVKFPLLASLIAQVVRLVSELGGAGFGWIPYWGTSEVFYFSLCEGQTPKCARAAAPELIGPPRAAPRS